MKFKVSAVLPTPADVYFVERDSSAFRSLVARMSNLESLEMGKSWMDGEAEVYEFITKPDIERYVPKQFKHFIPGGDLHYTDVIAYDPKEISKSPYRMKVTSIPPIFSSKAEIKSTLTIEEETAETCRQTLEGSIRIKIVGLGPIAERIVVDNLKNVYKHVPEIVERWVAFRNEIIKNPEGRDVLISGRPQNEKVTWINDRIKNLLKEDLPESDLSSEASSLYGPLPTPDECSTESDPHSRSPSLIGSEQTSEALEDDEEDEDVFFDAREQTSWLDMGDIVAKSHGKDPKLERQLERDTKATHVLLTDYQKTGRKLKKVELDFDDGQKVHSPKHHHPEVQTSVQSSRFSQTYNKDLAEWGKFWEEHEVPRKKENPQLKARLANLFTIGADAGLFKKKKERKHLVPWIHRKHRTHDDEHELNRHIDDHLAISGQQSKEIRKQASQDQENRKSESKDLKAHGSQDKESHEKGHRRSRSGPWIHKLLSKGHSVQYED